MGLLNTTSHFSSLPQALLPAVFLLPLPSLCMNLNWPPSFHCLLSISVQTDPNLFCCYLQKQLYSLAHFFSNTNPSTQLHPALPHRAEAPWPSGSLLELPPPCLLSLCLATTLTLSSSDTRLLTAKPMSQPYPVSSLHMHLLSDSG